MSTHEITAPPPALRAGTRGADGWAALPVLLAGTFMIVLDFFIVNVAMPAMQADLHAGTGAIEWVVAGYGLTFAVLLITAGRLGDRHGRRRMFGLGLALFTLASAACGLAWSPGVLVAARLAQGMAAALLSPQVLSIMGVVFHGEDRAKAMGIYGVVLGLAAAGGQLIGGVLIHADVLGLGWRSCFLINVPIGLVALALLPRLVPESRAADGGRLDLVGTVLVTLALTDVVLPLVEGRQHGWPAWTWLSLAGAVVTSALFVAHLRRTERRGGAPLLPTALLTDRAVAAGLFTQLFFWCGQASFFLVFALYLQPGRGLDALGAGLVFTIVAAAYLVASAKAPELGVRLGRRLVTLGGATLAAGHALTAVAVTQVGTGGSVLELAPGLLLIGAGMGLCIPPLTTIVMSAAAARPDLAGAASGALNTVQQVGNALGVAITGVLFFGAVDGGYDHAFTVSLAQLAGLGALVTILSRLLPERG
jgi:EmrB/QacA subfamily drug resistance transporter